MGVICVGGVREGGACSAVVREESLLGSHPPCTHVCLLPLQFASGECILDTRIPLPTDPLTGWVPGGVRQPPPAHPPESPSHSPYSPERALHLSTQCVHEPSQHGRCCHPGGTVSVCVCASCASLCRVLLPRFLLAGVFAAAAAASPWQRPHGDPRASQWECTV